MKKTNLLVILSLLLLFVYSCKSEEEAKKETSEEFAEEFAEEFTENLIESVSDAGIEIDINEDGETAEISIEGEDGTVFKVSNEGKDIPENFPKDVYLVKGDIESVGTMGAAEGEMISVVINPKASYDDVIAKIKKEMKSNGWTNSMSMNVDGEAMLMYAKGNNSATITVNGKEDPIQVAYLVTALK
jgi:hypothetical protein